MTENKERTGESILLRIKEEIRENEDMYYGDVENPVVHVHPDDYDLLDDDLPEHPPESPYLTEDGRPKPFQIRAVPNDSIERGEAELRNE